VTPVAMGNAGEKPEGSCNACPPTINYVLKIEVAIALHLELCFTHYTALQMNNIVRNFSAIKPGQFRKKHDKASGKPYHAITNQHLG